MKLILSSCDFRNENSKEIIFKNLPCSIDRCNLLFIPNEKATARTIASDLYYSRMEEHGFKKENIYVFDHCNVECFRNLEIDVIYISGDNTFGTLDKIRKCGFDKDIVNYVKSGVVYIGGSAGAHIVTENIEHIKEIESPPKDMTDFQGLQFFKGILVCHYNEQREYLYNRLLAENKYKVYKLTDDEAIVVN